MSSVIRGSDNMDSATVEQGRAQAWVHFNGTGTVAINDSLNVTSITDNGTGDYTINFTTAMANANYAVVGSASRTSFLQGCEMAPKAGGTYSTTAVQISTANDGGGAEDSPNVGAAIFGD